MDERGIIIADRDAEYRKDMADFFQKAGYSVETTDSAVHVLCSILEKKAPVLLLGSDFDKKVSSADLIHLLKKCNKNLNVILVSDQMPLAQIRKVREEGIFYHALKPATASDTEEIGTAVECAFQKQSPAAIFEPPPAPPQMNHRGEGEAGGGDPSGGEAETPRGKGMLREVPWLTCLILLVFGASYLSLFATESAKQGSSTGIWLFLGFCAFIIITQLIPIFLVKLPPGKEAAKREVDPLDR